MEKPEKMEKLTPAQKELYDWLVEYIRTEQHAPSIRQMMRAMNLKSPAPIQSRLERLRKKKYIDWTEGKARTIRILYPPQKTGLPIEGAIAAGQLVEPFTDDKEQLDILAILHRPNCFALRVTGDSMIEDMIREGDFVVMQRPPANEIPRNGEIVAARVDGAGTTLKRFYKFADRITLKPSNPAFDPIEAEADQVEIQGILVGVWRDFFTQRQIH
ncbi:transcriptional repressor LexA [Spirulina sp. 06S082]|nr:transcriptional repressor LexA [Spirulina sp. 06S082]MEA5468892.1 transcriptional repressor LexA [Spirulina sp. 06S082]